MGILLCDDLMFSSRITATARAAGLSLRVVRSPADIATLAAKETVKCVILDLALAGRDIADLVARLAAGANRPYIVAYGSHVDTAVLHAARQAGCDVVLPRSKFVEQLPTEITKWFADHEQQSQVSDA